MVAANYATSNDAITSPLLFPREPERQHPVVPAGDHLRLQKRLDALTKGIESALVKDAVQSVFIGLNRLREVLRIVELNVGEGGPLPVTLAAFALVDGESKALVRVIETRVSKIKGVKGPLREALDGMSFALRHELKRVFAGELGGLNPQRPANQLRAEVMRAHGLLSNCFQQSIITLARVFDPSLGGEVLFDDYKDRIEQSDVLLKDLSSLVRLALQAEERQDTQTGSLLIRELKSFCHGTKHYLMYKDWEEFEDIAGAVTSSFGSARHGFILHCFATYLEALTNQVRMRTVLNTPPPDVQGAKLPRKPRQATTPRRKKQA